MKRVDFMKTLRKILFFVISSMMLLSSSVYVFAENDILQDIGTVEKTSIYINRMTDVEKEAERNRQVQEHLNKLNSGKFVILNDPADYKTEFATTKTVIASGYAGNQTTWFRFNTGGGFWYSESGGPTVSVSASFPKPFSAVSFSVGLGNKSTTGLFVDIPNDDTEGYYKLWVDKYYEISPYITYKRVWDEFNGETWIEYTRGYSKILDRADVWAKLRP